MMPEANGFEFGVALEIGQANYQQSEAFRTRAVEHSCPQIVKLQEWDSSMSVECVFTKYTGPGRCFNQFIPPLGLAYLSSALKQERYTCELFDLDLLENSPKDLLGYLGRCKPSILAVKLDRIGFAGLIKILEEAKKISPTTLIIGGGPLAQFSQETIFELTNAFDALITGEGDRAIVQMVEVAHGGRDLRDVENVLFRDENGSLIKKPTSVVQNLDELPLPDWELYDLERYLPVFLVSGRRGCPFACAFCNFNYRTPTRKRTLQSLQQEIRYCIERYGARLFALADSLPDVQLTNELCDWLIDSKTTIRWTSFGRIKYMNRLFEKMARAGWVALWFGVESGSEKILRRMNKLYTAGDVKPSISAAQKAGIKCTVGFIVGFPGEDESTLAETFRLTKELSPDSIVFSPFLLVPGSMAAENPEIYDIKPHKDWIKTYTYTRNLGDVPYFDVEGEDNVVRLKRFNPLVNNAYKDFHQYQLVDDSDYAELIASAMEGSVEDILWETDALLNSEDVRGWNAFLSRVWRATENIS